MIRVYAMASWVIPSMLRERIDPEFYTPDVLADAAWIEEQADKVKPLAKHLKLLTDGVHASPNFVDMGVLYLTALNIDPCHLDVEKGFKFTDEETYKRYDRMNCVPRCGDVLLSKSGRIGYAAVVPAGLRFSVLHSAAILRPADIDAYFLAAFLHSRHGQTQIKRFQKGAVQPMLHLEEIAEIRVPQCSTALQCALGNKVRKAERLRELAAAEMRKMESVLADIFGYPPATCAAQKAFWTGNMLSPDRLNPTEYHPYRLGAELILAARFSSVRLCNILTDGDGISGGATPLGACYLKAGVGFLRVQNILPNRLDLRDLVFIDDKTDNQLKRSRIRPYDIILTITGYPGIACCVQATDLPLNINQHSVRFAVREEWNPFYVAAFLNSPWGQLQIQRRAIGGTREALDYPSIRSLLIPQIDVEEQQTIGDAASNYAQFLRESIALVNRAKDNVDELLSGKFDQSEAIREGKRIESWLAANRGPSEGGAA